MLRNICIIAVQLIKLGFAKKQNAVHFSHVQWREYAICFFEGGKLKKYSLPQGKGSLNK